MFLELIGLMVFVTYSIHRHTARGLDPESHFCSKHRHVTFIGQVLETALGDSCWTTNQPFVDAKQPPGRKEVGCVLTIVLGEFISGLSINLVQEPYSLR